MEIFLIRHGESVGNSEKKLQGWFDSPLTEKGKRQAELTAERLTSAGIERVYSSPLSRALDTSQLIARRIGCEVEVMFLLKEIDVGNAEGLTIDEVENKYPDLIVELVQEKKEEASLPGGETLQHFHDRAGELWESLDRQKQFQTIACVSHGWMINALLKKAQGLPTSSRNMVVPNGAVQHLRCVKSRWEVVRLEVVENETPGMRVWQLF